MKQIKIKFAGFWPDFKPEDFFLTQILRKYYDVEICDDPEYVICSGSGFYDYLGYDQVRIMFSGENYLPDFNFVDYAISVYPVDFMDRHFSFPGLVVSSYDFLLELSKKNRDYSESILKEKTCFANLIASHESENYLRGDFLRLLSKYKRVESAGSFQNNMPGGEKVRMRDGSKLALQKKCKFTFCGESLNHNGFITEKIFDAFLADTIPIYYGSSTISEIINKKAFIDIRDFDSLEEVVERIIDLDQDDEKFLEMLRQPIFVQNDYVEQKIAELELFVRNIFDQPVPQAYRRCRMYMPKYYENQLLEAKAIQNKKHATISFRIRKYAEKIFWQAMEIILPIKRKLFPTKE